MDQNVKIITSCGTSEYKQTISSSRIMFIEARLFQAHAACYWDRFQVIVKKKSSGTLDTKEWYSISLAACIL